MSKYKKIIKKKLGSMSRLLGYKKNENHFRNEAELERFNTLQDSGNFDVEFYKTHYEDMKDKGEDFNHLLHFVQYGEKENRFMNQPESESYLFFNESGVFDECFYRCRYEDMRGQDRNFDYLLHFVRYGKKEKRAMNTNAFQINDVLQKFKSTFNQDDYLEQNPDIEKHIDVGIFENVWDYFIWIGHEEVRIGKRRIGKEFPYFDEHVYRKYNEDMRHNVIENSDFSLFGHFLKSGYREFLEEKRFIIGYYPLELSIEETARLEQIFDEKSYLVANKDIQESANKDDFVSGWDHFIKHGIKEVQKGQRTLNLKIPLVNEIDYLLDFEDIEDALKSNMITSPYKHFLFSGQFEVLEGKRVFL